MSSQEIVQYPAEVLRRPTEPVEQFDSALQALVNDMLDTMYAARGVGLAAPQVGLSRRIFVMDPQDGSDPGPLGVINPELMPLGDERWVQEEGCLSIPGFAADVERAAAVRLTGSRPDGSRFELELEGFPAVVAQHEYDHLLGILFVDYLSPTRWRLFEKEFGSDPWRWRYGRKPVRA